MLSDKVSSRSPVIGYDAPRYRINFLNPDGTIFRTEMLEVPNDDAAIQAARRLMNGRALDLWDGLRFIEFIPRIDPPA